MYGLLKKMLVAGSMLVFLVAAVPLAFAQETATAVELQALGRADAPYTLGIGDVVDVQVRNQPEFSEKYIVGPDGNIQYAFVGDIQAEGLTKE